jgi:hypothetical protein
MLYRIVLAEDEEWPNMANGHVFIPGTLVVQSQLSLNIRKKQRNRMLSFCQSLSYL